MTRQPYGNHRKSAARQLRQPYGNHQGNCAATIGNHHLRPYGNHGNRVSIRDTVTVAGLVSVSKGTLTARVVGDRKTHRQMVVWGLDQPAGLRRTGWPSNCAKRHEKRFGDGLLICEIKRGWGAGQGRCAIFRTKPDGSDVCIFPHKTSGKFNRSKGPIGPLTQSWRSGRDC
jgi:hypothetical protein